jgi:hypothetical protein
MISAKASPPAISASDVRFQARKVRSFANVKRGSGSIPPSATSPPRAILRFRLGAHATASGLSALGLNLGEMVPLELVPRERRQPTGLAARLTAPLLLAARLRGVQCIRETPFER